MSNIAGQTPAAKGKRFFAEALTPAGDPTNRVRVRVQVKPNVTDLRGQGAVQVFLELLDVDDPAPRDPSGKGADHDNDSDQDVKDNRGPASVDAAVLTIENGEAVTHVTTSLQPGDNYRVVASTNEAWRKKVVAHQPSQEGEVRVVAGKSRVVLSEDEKKCLSPMLTVWRTLHLEIDSMKEPPTFGLRRNFVTGTITAISDARTPDPRFAPLPWRIDLAPDDRRTLGDGSPDLSQENNKGNGRFENGTLRVGPDDGGYVAANILGNGDTHLEMPIELIATVEGRVEPLGTVMAWTAADRVFELDRPLNRPQPGRPADPGPPDLNGKRLTVAGVSWTIAAVQGKRIRVLEDTPLPFHLTDDDAATHPFDVTSTLLTDCGVDPECESDSARNVFAQAYVRIQRDLPSAGRLAPFFRNIGESHEAWATTLADGRDETTVDSPAYWVGYVQGAFQGQTFWQDQQGPVGDQDPDFEGEVFLGVTPEAGTPSVTGQRSDGRESVIYVEAIRDVYRPTRIGFVCGPGRDDLSEAVIRSRIVAHEVGHQFGLEHPGRPTGTLMDEQPGCLRTVFLSGAQLATIRTRGMVP